MPNAAKKSTPAPAKRTGSKPQAADADKVKTKEPKAPATPTYREVTDFADLLKSAKSAVKDSPDAKQALQLITHLSWKSPKGTVGWSKGTTADVVAFADDIAAPAGTPVPDAMAAALAVAEKGATEKPAKEAVAALARVIKAHG